MNLETLNALIYVKINTDFDCIDVYDYFLSKKNLMKKARSSAIPSISCQAKGTAPLLLLQSVGQPAGGSAPRPDLSSGETSQSQQRMEHPGSSSISPFVLYV
uniref:Uncharacterized protein n=1 Tax=Ditylenchus dipsaci TaxID=166011 RepID=A0A915D574_9BILA